MSDVKPLYTDAVLDVLEYERKVRKAEDESGKEDRDAEQILWVRIGRLSEREQKCYFMLMSMGGNP